MTMTSEQKEWTMEKVQRTLDMGDVTVTIQHGVKRTEPVGSVYAKHEHDGSVTIKIEGRP